MILRKRKGMALITVVLIAALFLISIIGISAKVISEKKVSNARASSERALVAAETGLSQVAFDIRNVNFEADPYIIEPSDPDFDHYLKINEIVQIPRISQDEVINCASGKYVYSSSMPYITYEVKIKKIDGYVNPSWTPDTVIGEEDTITVNIYVSGTVYGDSSMSDSSILARRVISAEYEVSFAQDSTSAVFDYALFSGGNIGFGGGSDSTINGDIFANGKISFNGTAHLDGTIYACDTIKFEPTSGEYEIPEDTPDEIPFPELNLSSYQNLAYAFKTGAAPYDGSTEGYPDTSAGDGLVAAVISSYLPGAEDAGDTVENIQIFYNDLMGYSSGSEDEDGNPIPDEGYTPLGPGFGALTSAQLFNLRNNVKAIVYYIDGNATISGDFYCEGVIVVSGSLIVTGNSSVNKDIENPNLAVLVKGNIEINGDAILNGLIYTEGHLNVNGNASLECTGALVSQYNISLNNITNVTYVDINLPNTSITGASDITTVEQTQSSWEEISYEEFQSP